MNIDNTNNLIENKLSAEDSPVLSTASNPLIILTGPTAVGKTELSINLAKQLNGEIISADSAQVYRGLDIGSAKITSDEMQGVPHHLIDILEPDENFDVTVFKRLASEKVKEIYDRGHIPIVVGGTGFYIQALLYDIDFDGEDASKDIKNEEVDFLDKENMSDSSYRKQLEEFIQSTGDVDKLHEELAKIDPVSAEKIHKNNVRKVIRALEYYHYHNEPISLHNERERKKQSVYNSFYFVLNMDRKILYDRINRRVDIMKDSGLVEEVNRLKGLGYDKSLTSMQAIGYKEIYDALSGEITLDEAFEQIKLNTRHFAKRQLTWFRREKDTIWIDKDGKTEDEILHEIMGYLHR